MPFRDLPVREVAVVDLHPLVAKLRHRLKDELGNYFEELSETQCLTMVLDSVVFNDWPAIAAVPWII